MAHQNSPPAGARSRQAGQPWHQTRRRGGWHMDCKRNDIAAFNAERGTTSTEMVFS
jgi:hypothetical protein